MPRHTASPQATPMPRRRPGRSRRRSRPSSALFAVLTVFVVLALGACGGDDGADGGGDASNAELGPEAAAGLELAKSNGCMTCHSVDGRRSVGPTWDGLYGSEVELDDGSTVIADDEYLTRAIEDPGDQIVKGFTGVMPDRDISSEDVARIVAYLKSLGD